jgi:ankyrin repeat protein
MGDNTPPLLINNLPSLKLFDRLECLGRRNHPLLGLGARTNKLGSVTHTFPNLDIELQGVHGDLVPGYRNPSNDTLCELFQVSCNNGFSPLVLPMLHLASNNLLAREQASDVMDSLLQSGSRDLFNALISAQSPATKAIARSLLPSAIGSLDAPMVKSLLDTGVSPDSYTMYSRERPLQLAARAGGTEISRLLLHYGAQVNLPCSEGSSSPLTIAARNGAPDLVQLLLGWGADVNAPNEVDHEKMTALQRAAEANKSDIVHLLLGAGTDLNAPALGTWGRTALQAAVGTSNIALVNYLLFHGADANAPAPQLRSTALQAAASTGNLELVDLLLEWGALDILAAMESASKQGHIQLVHALLRFGQTRGPLSDGAYQRMALKAGVRCGDYHFVRCLLEDFHIGVDASAVENDTEWTTALQMAAQKGHNDIAQLLITFGADVNASGRATALQYAAKYGNVELVKILLHAGADVNAPSRHMTALSTAAKRGNVEITRLLLESGVEFDAQGKEAIEYAVESREPKSFEIVQLLVHHNIEHHNNRLEVRAHFAIHDGDSELIRFLLEHETLDKASSLADAVDASNLELVELLLFYGADVNHYTCQSDAGLALDLAASSGELKFLNILLGHGANARAKARALQAAARENQVEAARILISSTVDVNAAPLDFVDIYTDYHSPPRTALQAAAGVGNLEMVRLLMEAGADVESKVRSEREQGTALQFAAIAGSISVASELIQHGADVNAPAIREDGRTALEGAAEHGRLDMVQLLLNVEAEARGSRAVRFARNEGHDGVVQLLLENEFKNLRMDEAN